MAQCFGMQCGCVQRETAVSVAVFEPAPIPRETNTARKEPEATSELLDPTLFGNRAAQTSPERLSAVQSSREQPVPAQSRLEQATSAQSSSEQPTGSPSSPSGGSGGSQGSAEQPSKEYTATRWVSVSTCTPPSELSVISSQHEGLVSSASDQSLSTISRVTEATMEQNIKQVEADISPWLAGEYSLQKRIQDAPCNHGKVLLMHGKFGEKVAVKKMPNAWVRAGYDSFKQTYQTAAENPWSDMAMLKILGKVSFPHSVRLLGVFRDSQHTYMCSEFATGGDVFDWCNTTNLEVGPLREKTVQPMLAQLITAVLLLHELGIAHRDISIENILLTDSPDGKIKVLLGDYGMAVASRECSGIKFGKKQYRAPELHAPDLVCDSFRVDNFAVGVVLFSWTVNNYPWQSTDGSCPLYRGFQKYTCKAFLSRRKADKSGSSLLTKVSPELLEMMDGLLQRNPNKRSCVGEECFPEDPSVWDNAWLCEHARPEDGVPHYRIEPARTAAEHEQPEVEFRVIV